jgi:hypothetical protein
VLADLITGIQYTAFCQENGKEPTTITLIFNNKIKIKKRQQILETPCATGSAEASSTPMKEIL